LGRGKGELHECPGVGGGRREREKGGGVKGGGGGVWIVRKSMVTLPSDVEEEEGDNSNTKSISIPEK